jgi:hypothetical protein
VTGKFAWNAAPSNAGTKITIAAVDAVVTAGPQIGGPQQRLFSGRHLFLLLGKRAVAVQIE